MKRVLKGVHVLMAVGLIVALAACSGSNGSLKRERDQAQAAAAAAEAAAAQAAADKMAAEAAAAQAEADKMAADEAAAQAEADKMAAEAAAAQAEADKMAAEAAAAQAEADKMAAAEAAAQAAAQAEADKMAAAEAAAQAAAQAAADLMAAEEAAAQAAADLMAAEEAAAQAAAQAAAEKKALEDELAGVPKTIEELEAALMVASDALTAAAEAQAAADTALADATVARMAAQAAVDASEADGLTDAIVALQAARAAEAAAEVAAMAAAEVATAAEADVATVQAAVDATDTGPASETLTEQAQKVAIAGARKAFTLLDSIVAIDDTNTSDVVEPARRETDTTLKVSHDGEAAKFSATMTDGTTNRTTTVFSQADANMAPAITGWSSATLTGTKATNKATAMTYSNIDAPKDKLFAVQYGAKVTLGVNAETANPNWARSKIPAANEYTGGVGGGSIQGSFRGVNGTFTCDDGCPASDDFPERRTDGTIIGTEQLDNLPIPGTTWTFTPADEAAMIKVADSDYLSFGYWLSKNKANDPVGFAVWYTGSVPAVGVSAETAENDINQLDEKVTYTGAAAGKYVIKDDVANTASAGYFTASAELTADFTATPNPGTIKGTISSFTAGDAAPLGDLKLELSGTLALNARALTVAPDGAIVEAVISGAKQEVGGWEAQLFGRDKTTNVPTGVAGAFNATIDGQAVVVGGFGATK